MCRIPVDGHVLYTCTVTDVTHVKLVRVFVDIIYANHIWCQLFIYGRVLLIRSNMFWQAIGDAGDNIVCDTEGRHVCC